ncbi:MAG TPA: cytochrome d ubiquinol oxidase subunit II [Candidatus Saccharimonadales bacterium]|nr:cytochrome d ubiquinol oxidase subunit II [Candidatus Saccharimonadales bacterium]
MSPETALFVAAVFFSIYLLLCGIECGVALVRMFPRLSTQPRKHIDALRPTWEASNVFLMLGIATFGIFFANAVETAGHVLAPYLSVILIAMVMRAALFSYVYYRKVPTGVNPANTTFALVCFSVPLLLACLGYYLLNGANFWEQSNGWVVIAAALTSIAAIGLAPALSSYGSKHYWLLSCLVYVFALAPLALVWGNMPYLIYKTMTLDEAFSAPAEGDLILITLLLSIPVLILGFIQVAHTLQLRSRKTAH